MDKFLKEYDGKGISDACGYNSKEMVSFSRKFRNYLKRTCKACEVKNFSLGHYEVSGFLSKNGEFVYFDYAVPRGEYPINILDRRCASGVLIRRAHNCRDYRGGQNHFCSLSDIAESAESLFESKFF